MFTPYKNRPETTTALKVTRDNYGQVIEWIKANLPDLEPMLAVTPGAIGEGAPGIYFKADLNGVTCAPEEVFLPIPGYLVAREDDEGRPYYEGISAGLFDHRWKSAT